MIEIAGYASRAGSRKLNQQLSQERAAAGASTSMLHANQIDMAIRSDQWYSGPATKRYYGVRLKALFTRTLEGLPLVAMSISGTYVQVLAATRP